MEANQHLQNCGRDLVGMRPGGNLVTLHEMVAPHSGISQWTGSKHKRPGSTHPELKGRDKTAETT